MVFQPADKLHSALGEALDALLENSQSASAIAFGLGIALGECFAFALVFDFVADPGFPEDLLFHQGHEVVGQAQQAGLTSFRVGGAGPRLGFAEFIFEFVEDFLNIPA